MYNASIHAKYYQPITPSTNKLLKKRWDEAAHKLHRIKVSSMKSSLDNKAPRTYMHLHVNSKKCQKEEERKAVIHRDNYLLLQKMAHIMKTRGMVDNVNDYQSKSLNAATRQRVYLKIAHENQAILKRMEAKEPYYSHMDWVDQWRVNEGYRGICSRYPLYMESQEEIQRRLSGMASGGAPSRSSLLLGTPKSPNKIKLKVQKH